MPRLPPPRCGTTFSITCDRRRIVVITFLGLVATVMSTARGDDVLHEKESATDNAAGAGRLATNAMLASTASASRGGGDGGDQEQGGARAAASPPGTPAGGGGDDHDFYNYDHDYTGAPGHHHRGAPAPGEQQGGPAPWWLRGEGEGKGLPRRRRRRRGGSAHAATEWLNG